MVGGVVVPQAAGVRRFVPIVTVLLLVVVPTRAGADPVPSLDVTYGEGGVARITDPDLPPPGGSHDVLGIYDDVDELGRAVVLGIGNGTPGGLYRLTPDGRPDPSFGTAGRAHPTLPSNFQHQDISASVSGIAISGWLSPGSGGVQDTTPVVIRLLPNGSVDDAFGTGGRVALPRQPGDLAIIVGLDLAADGSLAVVLGDTGETPTPTHYVVYRLTPSGALDLGFGTGGAVRVGGSANIDGGAVQLDAAGRVVVASVTDAYALVTSTSTVRRFRTDGSLDPSFGDHGVVALGDGAVLAVDVSRRDSSLALAGTTNGATHTPLVWKLRPDGSRDPGFGTNGLSRALAAPARLAWDVAALPSGDVAISADTTDSEHRERTVSVLRPDGTLETSFGTGGTVPSVHWLPWDGLGVGADGQLLVVRPDATNSDAGFNTTVTAFATDGLPVVAPAITSVTPGRGALSVRWVPSEVPVGGVVRAYQVLALEGGVVKGQQVVAGDVRETTVTGVVNGHAHQVLVIPITDKGALLASEPATGTPAAAASAPVASSAVGDLTVVTGKQFATLSWKPPADDGGSPLSGYAVIAIRRSTGVLAAWRNVPADVRTLSVPGLRTGVPYDLYVVPVTGAGYGAVGAPLGVTPTADGTAPAAPVVPWSTATAVGSSAYVAWGPAAERGEAVTAYDVVVIRNGAMTGWSRVAPEQRNTVVPIGSTGTVDVYVFAESASGFGPLTGPLPARS